MPVLFTVVGVVLSVFVLTAGLLGAGVLSAAAVLALVLAGLFRGAGWTWGRLFHLLIAAAVVLVLAAISQLFHNFWAVLVGAALAVLFLVGLRPGWGIDEMMTRARANEPLFRCDARSTMESIRAWGERVLTQWTFGGRFALAVGAVAVLVLLSGDLGRTIMSLLSAAVIGFLAVTAGLWAYRVRTAEVKEGADVYIGAPPK